MYLGASAERKLKRAKAPATVRFETCILSKCREALETNSSIPIMMLSQWIAFALYAAGLYSLFFVTLIFYRRFFHPLSHVPGPLLEKTTYLYER
jgi:hypothetical protein